MKCQCCGQPDVDMFDICSKCRWENDISLEDDDGNLFEVGFELTPEQRKMFSHANGESADENLGNRVIH